MNMRIFCRDWEMRETVFSAQNKIKEDRMMSDKRRDYLSWDEYFMGLRCFPGCVQKIREHRWAVVLSVRIIRSLSMGYNGFPLGVPMMLFHGQEMVRILWKQNMFILRTAS